MQNDIFAAKNHRSAKTFIPFNNSFIPYSAGFGGVYADPIFDIRRVFGTSGKVQTIPFQVHDADSSSIVLDGKGASDTYTVDVGLGSFIDVSVQDSDAATQNSLITNFNSLGFTLIPAKLTLTDNRVQFEYYTAATSLGLVYSRDGGVTWSFIPTGIFGEIQSSLNVSSVVYSPNVYFGNNVDVTVSANTQGTLAPAFFYETVIDRPAAPQTAKLAYTGPGGQIPSRAAVDFEGPIPLFLTFQNARQMDVQANAGILDVEFLQTMGGNQLPINIHANTGTLTFRDYQVWDGGYPTYNIQNNSGSLNIDEIVIGSLGVGAYVQGLTHVVNILANNGTINLHDVFHPAITPYGIDAQINVGDDGSLANVHGTVNLSHEQILLSSTPTYVYSIAGRYGLTIDDRNSPGTGGQWLIDAAQTRVGDLIVNYQTVNTSFPYQDIFSLYQAFPKSLGSATLLSDPRFYTRQLYGVAFPTWQLSGHPAFFTNLDGDSVNLANSVTGNPGGPVTFSATNLPAGLSINPTTGQITGTISTQAYLSSPYETVVAATNGTYTRGRIIHWNIFSGIQISVPNTYDLLGRRAPPRFRAHHDDQSLQFAGYTVDDRSPGGTVVQSPDRDDWRHN